MVAVSRGSPPGHRPRPDVPRFDKKVGVSVRRRFCHITTGDLGRGGGARHRFSDGRPTASGRNGYSPGKNTPRGYRANPASFLSCFLHAVGHRPQTKAATRLWFGPKMTKGRDSSRLKKEQADQRLASEIAIYWRLKARQPVKRHRCGSFDCVITQRFSPQPPTAHVTGSLVPIQSRCSPCRSMPQRVSSVSCI
jgi:hypothetical protein